MIEGLTIEQRQRWLTAMARAYLIQRKHRERPRFKIRHLGRMMGFTDSESDGYSQAAHRWFRIFKKTNAARNQTSNDALAAMHMKLAA